MTHERMIEIVQRTLNDMKDVPPPSAAIVSDARNAAPARPDGDDNSDAATLKKGSSNSKRRMELLVERGELSSDIYLEQSIGKCKHNERYSQ